MADLYKIVTDNDSDWEALKQIAKDDRTHSLWENYQKFDLNTYEHMIVNIRDDIPAAFHGIYNNGRWPENISRICNRAYINPYFRELQQGLEITYKNISYVLENYDRWGKDILFISRGVQYDNARVSWKKFQKFCDFLIRKTGFNLEYDNYLYQCCANPTKDCYQFCVWYDPKGLKNSLDLSKITVDQWIQLD